MSTESNDPNRPASEPEPSAPAAPDMPIPPAAPPPGAAEPPPSAGSSAGVPHRTGAGMGAGTNIDFAAVPRSVWISLGGAVVLLISVFFSWYTASVSVAGNSGSTSESGWDSGSAAKLIALLALVAIVAWAVELFAPTVALPFPAWMIAGAAGALALLLVLFKIVSKPGGDSVGQFNALGIGHVSIGTAWGIWLALLATIAVLVGAYLRMNESA